MRSQTFCRSRCSSLPGSLSFQRAAIDEDDSKLFRSRQAEQIIPAVLPKADSRIELSDPWGGGSGGLSASNLSFKHLSRRPSVGCSTHHEITTLGLQLPSREFGTRFSEYLCDQATCNLITLHTLDMSRDSGPTTRLSICMP